MRRKKGARGGKVFLGLISVFVLLVSMLQPVSAVAAGESFKVRLTTAVEMSLASESPDVASVTKHSSSQTPKMAQVVDVNICAILLGNNLIDVNGNVTVDAGSLLTSLTNLVLSGQLNLNLLDLSGLVGVLVNGGCVTQAPPEPVQPTAVPVQPTVPPVQPTVPPV